MALDLFGPSLSAGGVTVRPSDTRLLELIDTWFKDCSDPETEDGTEDQAAWRNAILAMLRALARGNGQTIGAVDIVTENNANDAILLTAIQFLIQRGIPAYADDSGAANTITLALSPALSEYKQGFRVWTKILNTNTGNTTININALGAKAVKTVDGSQLAPGSVRAGMMACFEYDGTDFQQVSVLGAAAFSLPKARIDLTAIGALTNATYGTHGMSVASSNDMGAGPSISGGNAVILPAGSYSFQVVSSANITLVNNNTQVAFISRMLKNGVFHQLGFEGTYLLAGQNATMATGFPGVVQVNGTDTLQIQTYLACTSGADFGGGNAPAGSYVTFQRIGA